MARLTKKVEKDFTVVHNAFIRDKRLGLTARGLLLTMLSMSDNFNFSIKGLASILPDGETKVSSALKELEKHGYLKRKRIYGQNGRFLDVEYAISDEPIFLQSNLDEPQLENPNVVETNAENRHDNQISKESNTKESNTDVFNINQSITDLAATDAVIVDKKEDVIDWMDLMCTVQSVEKQIEKTYLESMKNANGMAMYEKDEINELVQLIAWVYVTPQKSLRINGVDVDITIVRDIYHRLNEEHIIYVLDCLKQNTVKINARRNYLLTALYNAPTTIGGYYSNLVQHDLYG